ncbi:acyl-CoA dehydrogenase family protein [Phenylobacterium sp.]|uniref:acyl-CoA dehydrogenase family protein n=1 Tax=Phenylobacterium sp. TaxID=1871053 RepID=UPI002DE2AE1C|nr:acyl-CoA dehydrogenase family protein [Phenylobacterium sp.]
MRFLLSDDQMALQAAVRDYACERADAGARRSAFEGDSGFDAEFWRDLMALGAGGIAAPEAAGGLGAGVLELALAAEALGYAGAPGPFLGHVLAIQAISLCGSEAQKALWLPRLAAGEALGTVALAEAGERVRPDRWAAKLRKGALTTEKRDVLYPELADVTVVGVAGGFALVEKAAADQTFEPRDVADRTRRLSHVSYFATPAEPMPADADQADQVVDAALVLLAADAFGGAQRLLDMAVGYAKTREQFGGPIGRFQGLKHQLANLAVDIEPARGLWWYAAYAHDRGAPDRSRMAALAKAHLGDVFMQAARTAVEAHGGIGYTWEYDAQIWFKRAMFDFAYLGAPSRHRERAAQLAGW